MPDDETIEALLAASADDQQEVTDQLGYQVRRAVELLVQAIDLADQDRGGSLLAGVGRSRAVRGRSHGDDAPGGVCWPPRSATCCRWATRSTTRTTPSRPCAPSSARLADQHGEEVLERRVDAWCRLLATFRAVHGGIHHDRLHLPAYGGRLFDPDRFPFLEGRPAGTQLAATRQPTRCRSTTAPCCTCWTPCRCCSVKAPGGGPAEARRLSFRALDIEQIGHVYEGLLDHTAVRAGEPVLGLAGTKDREPEVPLSPGGIHFTPRRKERNGGARKSSADLAPLRELFREDD